MTPEQTTERSALEGKERAELQSIADAVGAKVTTRMKKSEMVEAILEHANGGGSDAAGASARRSNGGPGASAGTDDDDARDDRATRGDDSTQQDADGDRSDPSGTDGPDTRSTTGPQHRGGDGNQRSDRRPSDGGGSDGGGYDDFGPSGNRRRRRRGRGRGGNEPMGGGGGGGGHEPQGEPVECAGVLEIREEGYGFLRTSGLLPGKHDVYVSASQVRKFGLRKGDELAGAHRPPTSSEKYPALMRVDSINGMDPEAARARPKFGDLTPLFPDSKLRMELPDQPDDVTGRIIDLISPIGKGQRGMIVSPPKAGKTTIMKHMVTAIETNNPEVDLIVLLVDERPEEVTDFRRHVKQGSVYASTFDRPPEEHTAVAELSLERAKRLVEMGHDVVILLDGITRLARAYNLAAPASGRILSGGVDSTALYPPKYFFGAARNIEEGGSITIIATSLVETGSRMDEVIFEEFKGTGNMELRLVRSLADRRIYPAIDVDQSSTRHEELLFSRTQLNQVWKLRRVLGALEDGAGLELLMDKIKTTKNNDEFLEEIAKAPTAV
ncbi:MAG TPA: transcription termination factor Rho [Acidimicrobiia bacterium]|nr:transcription termination factor Rho [Acidimicrobiia bacterium]